jgi:hypothetical protein
VNYHIRALNIVLYAAFAWLIPALVCFATGFDVAGWGCIGIGAVQFVVTVEVMMYLEE